MKHTGDQGRRVKLERILPKLGLASRTEARKLIIAGRVRVDGKIERRTDVRVDMDEAKITLDDRTVEKACPRTFLFYKPRGVVTTRSDEKQRRTVFSFFESQDIYLHAVGRLDQATSGLLIITNDSALSNYLTDPKNGIIRRYLVSVKGHVKEAHVDLLKEGICDAGETLRAESVLLRKASGKESHLTVELREGKNREIRRLFKSLGFEVTRLKRVAFGGLELGAMKPGEYRELSEKELRTAFPRTS